ncbi:hypothetical protein [Alcanivorax sp. 1008]|uniref:hypothetical protein n=1 Tax=Alcanivorax sp. 1008 TaxID=2816853 RepID=UPI001DA1DFCD|nr:hypothetical protein [Alcanivorax sp. 1008]MCC1497295.1 hypothetical protein [Alcanivorax sp. 1008]
MMAQGCRTGLGVLLACLTWFTHAGELSVASESDSVSMPILLVGPDNNYTSEFQAELTSRMLPSLTLTADADVAGLAVALGEDAFVQAQSLGIPVIGVHVSRSALQSARDAGCLCSAVYREATTAAQILVLREMLPAARRVGVLLGPGFAGDEQQLEIPGILFERRSVSNVQQLPAVLAELLPRVDVLLALPDPALYNADTARLILLSSYRQGKPVIGPDEQFVRAGSLAAAYPSVEGMIEATLKLLQHDGLPATMPEAAYARAAVAWNVHVARSYGVIAPDIPAIERRLEAQQ